MTEFLVEMSDLLKAIRSILGANQVLNTCYFLMGYLGFLSTWIMDSIATFVRNASLDWCAFGPQAFATASAMPPAHGTVASTGLVKMVPPLLDDHRSKGCSLALLEFATELLHCNPCAAKPTTPGHAADHSTIT